MTNNVDSGASSHMLVKNFLPTTEKRTIRKSSYILDTWTANGYVVSTLKAEVHMKEVGINLWVHLVEHSPSVLSLGRLCKELCDSNSEELPK